MNTQSVISDNLIPVNGYAVIIVNLLLFTEKKEYKNLKGYIDTGAEKSTVNACVLSDLNFTEYSNIQHSGAGGDYSSKRIQNVGIIIPMLSPSIYNHIGWIDTTAMANGYDIVIGNDLLKCCEFIYDGKKATFSLKYAS